MQIENHVTPLKLAENHLVQALVSNFRLYGNDGRCSLAIKLRHDTPSIRRRESKSAVQRGIPANDFQSKSARIQKSIDAVLQTGDEPEYLFSDDTFFFRYVSGGTLPLLEIMEDGGYRSYFCLFYRDTEPVGWNIANGGADSIAELLNPAHTILRELKEELIVLDDTKRIHYTFRDSILRDFELPEYDTARILWSEYFHERDFRTCEKVPADIEWTSGPDTLEVTLEGKASRITDNCFLNITTEDCAIEVDRVAKIRFPSIPVLSWIPMLIF